MATPLSLEAQQLLKQLADGQWRHREDVVSALAPKVAPGRALRRFESDSLPPEERFNAEPTDDEKIRMGQRRVAMVVVRSMKRRYLECENREDGEWVRLRPEPLPPAKSKVFRVPHAEHDDDLRQCDVCGGFVLTSQQEDHEEFHAAANDAGRAVETPKPVGGRSGNPRTEQAGVVDSRLTPDMLRSLLREELSAAMTGDTMHRLVAQEINLAIGGRLLRQLVHDEVGLLLESNLDDFQAGLQRFLNTWMESVERAIFTSRVTNTKLLGGSSRT